MQLQFRGITTNAAFGEGLGNFTSHSLPPIVWPRKIWSNPSCSCCLGGVAPDSFRRFRCLFLQVLELSNVDVLKAPLSLEGSAFLVPSCCG